MLDTKRPAEEMPAETGPLWQLTALGQSVWLDYIRREILQNGELERMIRENALRGVTSNPAIFEQAIAGSDDYDQALTELASQGVSPLQAYERLAIEDIQAAADLFRATYDQTQGEDGFVSLEVSPELAHDIEGTLQEARRLWREVDRPNVMIKVPGTFEGVRAVESLLEDGVNVNITLLFSLEDYERVMEAYLAALEKRVGRGEPVDQVASVASFFISRVDTSVDQKLNQRLASAASDAERERIRALLGKAAIANAKLAYGRFTEIFGSERFAALRRSGARVQRPLWASTSTKNPDYRDVIYAEALIGPQTVNTMPLATLEAFADHGIARRAVDEGIDEARAVLGSLEQVGISFEDVTRDLQLEAVDKFVDPFRKLLRQIEEKLSRMAARV